MGCWGRKGWSQGTPRTWWASSLTATCPQTQAEGFDRVCKRFRGSQPVVFVHHIRQISPQTSHWCPGCMSQCCSHPMRLASCRPSQWKGLQAIPPSAVHSLNQKQSNIYGDFPLKKKCSLAQRSAIKAWNYVLNPELIWMIGQEREEGMKQVLWFVREKFFFQLHVWKGEV